MKINVHAGHNPDGMKGCGAFGIRGESTMNREVVAELIPLLEKAGHQVKNCTINNGANARDVLERIVAEANSWDADLDISIHHNACVQDYDGDGKTTGVECYAYGNREFTNKLAKDICANISSLGFRDRGIQARPDLYVIKHTKAPAVLVECCFCDDRDDMNLWNAGSMAYQIATAIDPSIGKPMEDNPEGSNHGGYYKVQIGAFKNKENAQALRARAIELGMSDAFIQEI